jgi:hypothetical protein
MVSAFTTTRRSPGLTGAASASHVMAVRFGGRNHR